MKPQKRKNDTLEEILMKTVTKLLPGCAIALVLAAIAKGLES